jgi:hypothetical protein
MWHRIPLRLPVWLVNVLLDLLVPYVLRVPMVIPAIPLVPWLLLALYVPTPIGPHAMPHAVVVGIHDHVSPPQPLVLVHVPVPLNSRACVTQPHVPAQALPPPEPGPIGRYVVDYVVVVLKLVSVPTPLVRR